MKPRLFLPVPWRLGGLLGVVAAAGVAAAASPAGGSLESGVMVLDSITVVDAETGRLVPHQRVVIRGDSIVAVEPVGAPPPADVRITVHGAGLFVIPGLVDHHVHLSPGAARDLERAARGGVTLVQVMAGDNRTVGELSRAVRAGEVAGPEIAYASVMAGPGFFEDPRFLGAGLGYAPGEAPWVQAVSGETDVVTAVAAARGSGAEVLKIYAMMEAPMVASLAEEARKQGMRVVAHATVFPARPADLLAAGVDALTHAPYLSWQGTSGIRGEDAWSRRDGPYGEVAPDGAALQGVLATMARDGTHLEPTLWVFHRAAGDSVLQSWARTVTRAADAAGVPILAGTDGMIDPGSEALPNIHREMELLVEAGLSPSRALAAATIVPARFMGRGTTHGAVAPGRVADLVVLEADPLADIRATTRIRYVVRRGRLLDPLP